MNVPYIPSKKSGDYNFSELSDDEEFVMKEDDEELKGFEIKDYLIEEDQKTDKPKAYNFSAIKELKDLPDDKQFAKAKKEIENLFKKKVGIIRTAEKDGVVHVLSKDTRVKEIEEKLGRKIVYYDAIDRKGKFIERSLEGRKIVYHELSEGEHDRILGIGLISLKAFSEQIESRKKQVKIEKERGKSYLKQLKVTVQYFVKYKRILQDKILREIGVSNVRLEEKKMNEKIRTEERQKKKRTDDKDAVLKNKTKTQINNIEGHEKKRKEDVESIDINPKPPRAKK